MSWVSHPLKSISTFQITKILLRGDISMNPGPPLKWLCSLWKDDRYRSRMYMCHWRLHIKCGKIKPLEFDRIKAQTTNRWLCDTCSWSQVLFHNYCQHSLSVFIFLFQGNIGSTSSFPFQDVLWFLILSSWINMLYGLTCSENNQPWWDTSGQNWKYHRGMPRRFPGIPDKPK